MSGEGGSNSGGFLSRWSQRKRALAVEPAVVEEPKPVEVVETTPPDEEFDVSLLPSIDEITGESDVVAFLQKGVPEALKNAALHKVWTLDPILKDYIGPVDYGWDFNDPAGVPGFGPLNADLDIAAMSRQIFGEKTPEEIASETAAPVAELRSEALPEPSPVATTEVSDAADTPPQASEIATSEPAFPRRKRHGGAVPG
ncbi:MAG: hypothetical protein CFE31_04645 [Rhizobiales bacterium PAR1]|nr:MAG: hypothetical protein CFE31_04645 [Rhizobiales bacterium PAR1]